MSLAIDSDIKSHFINKQPAKQAVTVANQNFIKAIPTEIIKEIFLFLNLPDLEIVRRVCRSWKEIASHPILQKHVIYRDIAFSNAKWAKCFGDTVVKDEDSKEEYASLPVKDFIESCRNIKKIFPEKAALDSLMLVRLPKTLNGGLTINNLGELAKKYFPNSDTGYYFIWQPIVDQLGNRSIDQSRWVLMTKDVLPGSRSKDYVTQQAIVTSLAGQALIGYEIPEVLPAAACILAQHFADSETRLFSDSPRTYTRCQENVQGLQLTVGGFVRTGLFIITLACVPDSLGIAAMRKCSRVNLVDS